MTKFNIIGIVGNNAPFSYNRILLKFMQRYFNTQFNLDVCEIEGIPLFNERDLAAIPKRVSVLSAKIKQADGVIIATPEYDHAIPASLKSTIEWLSVYEHAITTKPVMIVGASVGAQGTARAQDNLRQILNSPGVNGFVMPGFEFLLNDAKHKFNEQGDLNDAATLKFLSECVEHFMNFVADNRKNLTMA